jgi:hypothetical protein
MPHPAGLLAGLLKRARLTSSLAGLLAVVVIMGACALSSQSGTSTGAKAGASTGPTATASVPGGAVDTTGSPTATTPPAPPTATKTSTPSGGIICCLTIVILPSVHQVLQQQTLTGTSVGPVTATCPAGELALSGGWGTNPSDGSNPVVYNSSRSGSGGWNVYVQHSGSTLVNAYALCLKNASGAAVAERYAGALSVSANTYGTKFASCNAGETLVGGGFASSSGLTLYNFTASGASWGGYVWNHTGSALPFSFYAECLTSSGSHSSFTGAGSGTGHAVSPACPSGGYVSGGGFASNQNSPIFTMSASSGAQAWETNDTPASGLNAYAMCVSL